MSSLFIVRLITLEDAPALIQLMKTLADEPNNMISYSSSSEFDPTLDEERAVIAAHLQNDNSTWMVAEAGGELIASATITGLRGAGRFTGRLGIAVGIEWRNQGVGNALISSIMDWGRENPAIKRIELDVNPINSRAIHVYRKMGFVEEGVRRSASFKYGRFYDLLTMAIVFDRPVTI